MLSSPQLLCNNVSVELLHGTSTISSCDFGFVQCIHICVYDTWVELMVGYCCGGGGVGEEGSVDVLPLPSFLPC